MILPYSEAKRNFFGGNFETASKMVENIEHNSLYERLLDNTNIALIHQAAKRYKLSNTYFEYVSRLAEEVEPITIKEVAGSLVTNEENFYYRLEDSERVLVHFFTALNYLALYEHNEAIVEFRRAERLLNKLSILRGEKFNVIPAFRFLAAFCYFLRGDYEDSKIELTKINATNFLTTFKQPQQLILILLSGIAPKKVPDPSLPFFPKYIPNFYEYKNYQVRIATDIIKPLFSINIGNILMRGLKKRLNSIRTKTLARIILKGSAGAAISNKKGWLGALAIAGLFSWEKPDTRSIDMLPDKIDIYYLADTNSQAINIQISGNTKYRKDINLFTLPIFKRDKTTEILLIRLPL